LQIGLRHDRVTARDGGTFFGTRCTRELTQLTDAFLGTDLRQMGIARGAIHKTPRNSL